MFKLCQTHAGSSGRIRALLLVLVLAAATAASADETGSSPVGVGTGLTKASLVEDYFRIAASNHPSLRASFERWNAAASGVAREKGWPDPVINYGYYIEPVQTAVGPQQHRLGLSQTIPWFGKLSSKGTAAEQTALAAEQDFAEARLQLFERVSEAYYEYAYLGEAIRVTEENLDLLTQLEVVVRARYRTQSALYSELIKAQVEQGVLEDRLATLRDRRGAVSARLNETLGRGAESPLPWPASLAAPALAVPEPEQVRARILAGNPQLLSLDRQIRAGRSRVEVEQKNALPDFNVGVQTILTGKSELTSFEGQGADAWVVTVGLALPLWRGQYRGAEDAARASERMLEHQYRDRQLDLLAEAEDVLFRLRDSGRKVSLYGDSLIPKARQSLEATARSLETGEATFLDFVDAQRTLLMFQLDHARAQADFGIRVMNVSRLMGAAPVDTALDEESGPRSNPSPASGEQGR